MHRDSNGYTLVIKDGPHRHLGTTVVLDLARKAISDNHELWSEHDVPVTVR